MVAPLKNNQLTFTSSTAIYPKLFTAVTITVPLKTAVMILFFIFTKFSLEDMKLTSSTFPKNIDRRLYESPTLIEMLSSPNSISPS